MSTEEKEYDLRQLRQMLFSIQNFRGGSLDLPGLIHNLSALRYLLKTVSKDWLRKFEPEWAALEEVYAVMLDSGRTVRNEMDNGILNNSLNELTTLIESEIQQKSNFT